MKSPEGPYAGADAPRGAAAGGNALKVAILTLFGRLDTTYSLVNVVAEQLRMLLDAGIPVKLLVCEQFDETSRYGVYLDGRIEWGAVKNTWNGRQIEWHDLEDERTPVPPHFSEEADAVAESLAQELAGVDFCLLHDILYQGWHLLHNVALRRAQKKLPGLRFLSFSHSAPLPRPAKPVWPYSARFSPLPGAEYVSFTYAGLAPLARQYGVPEARCRVVHNTLDLLEPLGGEVKALAEKADLLSPEVLAVYPARLTPAKRFEKAAAFTGALKTAGADGVRIVFCDFPSADVEAGAYRAAVRKTGRRFGLADGEMVFTSELGWPEGFPRDGVLGLFALSNLFVMPSFSEAFPLTVLEAASRGNLLVLNGAVPALREIGETLGAVLLRWDALNYGYVTTEEYHPSEEAYYAEHAAEALRLLREEPSLHAKTMVRRRYSPAWVWHNQLEPLLPGREESSIPEE